MCASSRLRVEMSWIWEMKWRGEPSSSRTIADRQQHPDQLALARVVALLHLVGVDLPGHQRVDLGEVGVEVVGVGDLLEGQVDQLLFRVADDVGELLVDEQEAAVEADDRDPVRGGVEGGLEVALGEPGAALGGLALGEVVVPGDPVVGVAALVARRHHLGADREVVPSSRTWSES